jgi:flagellin
MRINNNVAAMNTFRQLTMNTGATNKSLEKLSSGFRINKAADDAAGLAISEKMRSQIRGLDQAARNAQDGISLIQTAEGALNETHSILQRMRELAVQSSNGTATDNDRTAIQSEIDQLKAEVDKIGNTTEFNTMRLLDGSKEKKVTLAVPNTNILSAEVRSGTVDAGVYDLQVANKAGTGVVLNSSGSGTSLDNDDVKLNTASTTADVNQTYTISWTDGDSTTSTVRLSDASGKQLFQITANMATATAFNFGTGAYQFSLAAAVNQNGAGSVTFRTEMVADYTVTNAGGISTTETGVTSINGKVDTSGFRFEVDKTLANGTDNDALTVGGDDIELQIGANEFQTTKVSIADMTADALEIDDLDLSTQSSAQAAITVLDEAIVKVAEQRATLGAVQNRLDHTINNLSTSSENMTNSESRIRDVDMAKEMMQFTKNNIHSQAAQSMLAQANQRPEQILQLLR